MNKVTEAVRNRVDIKPAKHRSRPLLVGTIVVAIIFIGLLSAAIRHVPLVPRGGEEVHAEFAVANQVSSRTVVRVKGVEVGRVSGVDPGGDPRKATRVTMRLTDGDIELKTDARAAVRWRTLFGGLMYIDLDPGSPSAPKLGDRPIPVAHTSNQVELDQFLQPYDGDTDEHQRSVLKELRNGFGDPGGIRPTIASLEFLKPIGQGLEPFQGTEENDLSGLVAETSRTLEGLDDKENLAGLVTGGARSLAVVDTRREDLGEFLELSPPALDATYTTMTRLRATLDHLDPLARSLRPGARALAPAARAARPAFENAEVVLRDLRPLVRDADPTFRALRQASASGVPLMTGYQPTLTRLEDELLPFLDKRDDETRLKTFQSIGPFWSSLAMAAAEYDTSGHRIRFTVPPNLNSYVNTVSADSLQRSCERAKTGVPCGKAATLLAENWFGTTPKKAGRR